MGDTFRDRLLTPAGARAITAPRAILLAGAAAAATIVSGGGALLAGAAGAAGWLGGVAWGFPRARARPDVDISHLHDPWRRFVTEALDARARFGQTLRRARAGPIRERLRDVQERLDDGVAAVLSVASHGQELEEALERLEPEHLVRRRLERLREDMADGRQDDEQLRRTADALESQLASAARLAAVAGETRDRLRLLDARLDEAVARGVELSLGTLDLSVAGGLGSQIEEVVVEMEALRQAVEETGAGG